MRLPIRACAKPKSARSPKRQPAGATRAKPETVPTARPPKRASASEEDRRKHDEETKRKAGEVAKKRLGEDEIKRPAGRMTLEAEDDDGPRVSRRPGAARPGGSSRVPPRAVASRSNVAASRS